MRSFPEADPGTPDHATPLRYLRWLVHDHRRAILLGVLFASVWTVTQALGPLAVGRAVDAGIIARDGGALVRWGAVVTALGLVHAVGGIMQDRSTLSARLGAAYQTVQFITAHAARLGATLPKRVSTGEVVAVSVSDVTHIGNAMESATRGAGAIAAIVVVAAVMVGTSWPLGLVVLVGVPVMVFVTTRLIRPLHERQDRLRARQGALTDLAVDIVTGLRVLRGIGGEEVFAHRYRERSQRVRSAGVQVGRVDSLLEGGKVLLPGLLIAVVVWVGARQVLAGRLTPGDLVAFSGYAAFLAVPLRRLTQAAGQWMKAYVAAGRVVRFLALAPEIRSGTADPAALDGAAALTDPGSGLTVPAGRFTAVACASPTDATAIADRLGRYADSAARYGPVALRDLPLDEVRRRILVVDNADRLFSGPLRAELDPTDRGSDASLHEAIAAASAQDVLDALPGGLDATVVSAGREFSGGQRQRLRLVRALMADPEVLILVEPTNAVDAHTEARIADRLRTGRAGRTTLVFATSPLVLGRADRVSLVVDGRVVAEGPHGALLADPRYRSAVVREEAA